MRNLYYLLAVALLVLGGCKKETDLNEQEAASHLLKCTAPTSYCGTATTVNLITGQYTNIGSVTVVNDATNLYVTYSTEGSSWYLTQLHLYVGDANGIPKNWGGNPVVGAYPYSYTFCAPYGKTYTFSIPLANLPNCFVVSAHAAVVKKYGSNICSSGTAWGQGTKFGSASSWGMYFNTCKQSCQPTGEGCAYSAPYWFNGYHAWPTPSVTVAGYTYTQAEGYALGQAYNTNGYDPALWVLFQSACIKLSGNSVGRDASIWDEVGVIDTYLTGKGKITAGKTFAVPQNVVDAANTISTWQDMNDCDH